MTPLRRIPILALLLAALCFAQTGHVMGSPASGTGIISSGSGSSLTAGDTTTHTWAAISGTASCVTSTGILVSCFGGSPGSETRKDDGKGPTIQILRASAHRLRTAELAPASYIATAKSLGITTPAEEAQLLDAIHDADLTLYDFHQVDEYLWRQASRMKSSTRWVWKPIREADEKAVVDAGWQPLDTVGFLYREPYSKRVPLKAMADMKAVLEHVPNAVFLVSDFEVIRPDPFLAVSTPKLLAAGKIWIIDQWDEPGFGTDVPVGVLTASR